MAISGEHLKVAQVQNYFNAALFWLPRWIINCLKALRLFIIRWVVFFLDNVSEEDVRNKGKKKSFNSAHSLGIPISTKRHFVPVVSESLAHPFYPLGSPVHVEGSFSSFALCNLC